MGGMIFSVEEYDSRFDEDLIRDSRIISVVLEVRVEMVDLGSGPSKEST